MSSLPLKKSTSRVYSRMCAPHGEISCWLPGFLGEARAGFKLYQQLRAKCLEHPRGGYMDA